jgi:predicted metalloendopeptidase
MTDSNPAIDATLFDHATPAHEDFYRHVNGGWLDANPVPPEYGSWGAFHEVRERNQTLLHGLMRDAAEGGPGDDVHRMVGDYFAAAMDEPAILSAGVVPLEPWFARIGDAATVPDVTEVTRELMRIDVMPFHDLGIAPDFENADVYLAYLGQGGLGLPERDYYLRDDERSVQLRAAYAAHVARQLVNAGDDPEVARRSAEAIVALETALATASLPAEKMRDVQLTMNRHSVESLDDLMPRLGLAAHVRALGVSSESVNIDNAGFFTALDEALSTTPLETLRDYLRWNLIRRYASTLAPAFEEEAFDFYGRTLGGQQAMQPRWKRVIDIASADIGEPVSRLFISAAFSEAAKQRCEHMVDHLLSAMGRAIERAEWMSDATRGQALAKLAGFTYKIGYPDTWRDFSGLDIDRLSFTGNRMRCARFEYARQMGRLAEKVDRSEWEMPAHSVNAYYHPLLNEIVFPAGILQPPFFYADADDAVNYGAIGAVIGHEITHGFDDQGSHFDSAGSLRDWWTEADRAEFDRRAQVLVDQFDGYAVGDDLHVNGRLTLGENIADLGGLTIAFDALAESGGLDAEETDGFSAAQRFFLSWATAWRMNYTEEYARLLVNVDPHSPARYRVNGPLANFPSFAQAFSVEAGTPMSRDGEMRAHIW